MSAGKAPVLVLSVPAGHQEQAEVLQYVTGLTSELTRLRAENDVLRKDVARRMTEQEARLADYNRRLSVAEARAALKAATELGMLCWLPEMSQATVSRVVREMHQRCMGLPARTPTIAAAHYVGFALTERADRATEVLGTKSPSEFAKALTLLSPAAYATRYRLLGGIRVLPSGHLFEDDRDIFPELVARWSNRQPSPRGAG